MSLRLTSSLQQDAPHWPPNRVDHALAILASGGLDSAVLLGEAARAYPAVQPIFVRQGLAWEDDEETHLRRYLGTLDRERVRKLVVISQPMADVYGDHWSVTGEGVPGADTEDDAVYLPGRNALLLAKAMIFCHLHKISHVAMATLAGNPFPDALPEFFDAYQWSINKAVGGEMKVLRPYETLTKSAVLRRGEGMALEYTLSCIRPAGGEHCGACNKCAERRAAFRTAGLPDPTHYAA